MTSFGTYKEDGSFNNDTFMYKGSKFSWFSPRESIEAMQTFEVREDDIWLITFQKSGTTWATEILVKILLAAGKDYGLKDDPNAENAPYPEFHHPPKEANYKTLAEKKTPRLIGTHLLPSLLPPQLFKVKPKVIHVVRNPKDVVVSYYHHLKALPLVPDPTSWESHLEEFMTGENIFGDWATENLYWWEHRDDPNVLFLKYEDMKADLDSNVRAIADHLECKLTDDVIKRISEECTFKAMKGRKVREGLTRVLHVEEGKSLFFRKGTTWATEILVKVLLAAGKDYGLKDDPNAGNAPYPELHFPQKQANYETLAEMKTPRLIATHLRPSLLPPQLFTVKPKVIHVARNPKDVVVSYYHHLKTVALQPTPESWESHLKEFMAGETYLGFHVELQN
ncbi:sulfotransferase 6B1-like [Glandiceps talaboti]